MSISLKLRFSRDEADRACVVDASPLRVRFVHCRVEAQAKHLCVGRIVAIAIVRERMFAVVVYPTVCVRDGWDLLGPARVNVHARRFPDLVVHILKHEHQQRQRSEN